MMKKLNLIIAVCLLVFSVGGIWLSNGLPSLNNQDTLFSTKPSFYPLLVFCGLFLCALLMLVKAFFVKDEILSFYSKDFIIIAVALALYITLLPLIAFLPATILFTLSTGWFLLSKKDKTSVQRLFFIDSAIIAALYVLFVRILNVPL